MARADPCAGRPGERGAALLTVLLLVAVIAVMAGAMLEKLRLSTRLAANAASAEQARGWAVAAEALATVRVGDLLARRPGRVTLAGGWSNRPFGLPLPGGGAATARVTDGGNCFNLNSLVKEAAPGVYATDDAARVRFARLLRLVGVPFAAAEQVAGGAADWIDADDQQSVGGAEDSRYTGQAVGYRTAGTLMADVSELRAVAGVTADLYQTIKPWVCALPVAGPSPVNVNTLTPEQAPLLAMMADDTLSVDAARALLAKRPALGWSDAGAVWTGATPPADAQVAVTSTWFRLAIDVTMPGAQLEEHALIDARRLPVRLVSRQWGEDT